MKKPNYFLVPSAMLKKQEARLKMDDRFICTDEVFSKQFLDSRAVTVVEQKILACLPTKDQH
eukprot:8853177-Lingulodinium_polyedra.AAC.1